MSSCPGDVAPTCCLCSRGQASSLWPYSGKHQPIIVTSKNLAVQRGGLAGIACRHSTHVWLLCQFSVGTPLHPIVGELAQTAPVGVDTCSDLG